jgi:hypothetical protein
MRVVALIPAYNEEATIAATLSALATIQPLDEIVVINDGSTDQTANSIKQIRVDSPNITLLNLPKNGGKGTALNRGREVSSADVFLLVDADLGETASLAQELLAPVLRGDADMSIARFGAQQTQNKMAMGFGLVRRTACLGVWILTGNTVASPLSGQRAITAELLHTLGPFFEGFGVEIGLTVGALHHGFRVVEVPLAMQHRAYGRGLKGIRHRGRQLVHVFKALWRCWRRGWY